MNEVKDRKKQATAVVMAMTLALTTATATSSIPVYAQEDAEINPSVTAKDITEPEQGDSLDETETTTEEIEIADNELETESEEMSDVVNTITAGTETFGEITTYAENNAESFNVIGGTAGIDWTYDSDANTLTFNNSGTYAIIGDGQETAESIIVSNNFNGTITIENINIKSACAFEVKNTATLTLMLEGNNTLTSTSSAGILFDNSVTGHLIIDSNTAGSLTAAGAAYCAGIGGGRSGSGSNITINGGTVTATGSYGAGIGGGMTVREAISPLPEEVSKLHLFQEHRQTDRAIMYIWLE